MTIKTFFQSKWRSLTGGRSPTSEDSIIFNPGGPINNSTDHAETDEHRTDIRDRFIDQPQTNRTENINQWRHQSGVAMRQALLRPNQQHFPDLLSIREEEEEGGSKALSPTSEVGQHATDFSGGLSPTDSHVVSSPVRPRRNPFVRQGSEDSIIGSIVDGNRFDLVNPSVLLSEYSSRYNPGLERQRCLATLNEMKRCGWSSSASDLFYKLTMRGFEPLVPSSWNLDFETWPEVLFTPQGEEPYIRSSYLPEFHAIRAMSRLIQVGGRMRDTFHNTFNKRNSPEEVLVKEFVAYRNWALMDAAVDDIRTVLPLMTIASARVDQSVDQMCDTLLANMEKLGQAWKDALTIPPAKRSLQDFVGRRGPAKYIYKFPTLYGLIASGTVFAIVCYEIPPDPPQKESTLDLRNVLKSVGKSRKRSPSPQLAPQGVKKRKGRQPSVVSNGPNSPATPHRRRSSIATSFRIERLAPILAPKPTPVKVLFDNEDEEGIQRGVVRTVATFDFTEPGYDVWNALALAVFAVHVRKKMLFMEHVLSQLGAQ